MVAELEYIVKTTKFSIERKRLDIDDYPYVLEQSKELAFSVKNNVAQDFNISKKISFDISRNEPNKTGYMIINSNSAINVNSSNVVSLITKSFTIHVGMSYDDSSFSIKDSEIQFYKKTKLVFNTYIAGESIYTTPGTYTWTAPAGVTSVNVVCIGGGGVGSQATGQNGLDSWFINSTSLNGGGGRGWNGQFSSFSGLGGSSTGTLRTGGFEGGNGNSPQPGNPSLSRSGGGGAGGYTQAGENGGKATSGPSYGAGGGVGIYGGTNGGGGGGPNSGGLGGSGGTNGTMSVGGLYGGGGPVSDPNAAGHAGGGGGLAYGNNIGVTPGNTYNLQVGVGGLNGIGGNGAVRIIWGDPSVSFPSNASAAAVDNTVVVQDLNIESEYLYFKEENPKETYTKAIMSGKKNINLPQTIINSEVSLFTNRQTNIPLIVTDDQNNIQITKDFSSFTMTTFIPTVVTIGVVNKIKWGFFITDGIPQYSAITDENNPNLVVAPSTGPVQIWY